MDIGGENKKLVKNLLENKTLLYVIFFIAVTNFFGYLMTNQNEAVIIFLLTGLITSFFSKNMIVVMLAAIILTNLFVSSRYLGQKPLLEGMESKENASPKPVDEAEEQAEATGKPKVDYSATLEAAYDNIDKLLSSDALSNMSNETQRLAEKQQKLMGNIQKLEPMMQKAGSLLEGLDMSKISGLMNNLDDKLKKMNGGKK